ncbi:MAG: type 11 methyltransferase [Bacteroidetes bacterium]|nr:MAG: type 11 methyltransferase [Bacteroidota bacterium]
MAKKKKKIFKLVLKRFINPVHLWRVIRLQRNRKKVKRVYDDAQLKLYHQLLPGDYLHYGYFDDPSVHPLDMTINMIYKAQDRYAEKIAELVTDTQRPILDIGCGMGGLLGLMNKRGLHATGLTPDVNQARHIRTKYPNTLIESRFEDLDGTKYEKHFGTVITSESLQYLETEIALPLIDRILVSGGKWLACDYFRTGTEGEKSGHNWKLFAEALEKHRFRITWQEDITPNILPTIAYVHHWAANIGVPVKNFALEKLKVKSPGIHYALEEAIPLIEEKIKKNIDTVDPAIFAANKRYVLMVIERVV